MRLPNGYGSVFKMKDKNRRRPWCVRVNGKYIGYAKTKKEALKILEEYHTNPVKDKTMTFSELWEYWLEQKAPTLSPHTVKNYKSKYKNYCRPLYDMPYNEIRVDDFLKVVNSKPETSNGTKNKTIQFLRAMDRFAYELDLIDKKYSEFLESYGEGVKKVNMPFTQKEIDTLWEHENEEDVDIPLILIYSGLRSGELVRIKLENIFLDDDGENDESYMIGGFKTKAGTNRYIPIHPRIKKFIIRRVEAAKKDTLFNYSDKQLRVRFKKVMLKLGMIHHPHECRHTFVSLLSDNNADPVCARMITGHAGKDVGETVYTHKTNKQLQETIRKIP